MGSDDDFATDQVEGFLPCRPRPPDFRLARLCVYGGVERILPGACDDTGFAARQVSLGNAEVQNRLAKGLVFCLHNLCGLVFALGAEARAFAGERVHAVEFSSPEVTADETESHFHSFAFPRSYLLATPAR